MEFPLVLPQPQAEADTLHLSLGQVQVAKAVGRRRIQRGALLNGRWKLGDGTLPWLGGRGWGWCQGYRPCCLGHRSVSFMSEPLPVRRNIPGDDLHRRPRFSLFPPVPCSISSS